jgi:hypothetical protein
MSRGSPIIPFESIINRQPPEEADPSLRTRSILSRADVIYAVDTAKDSHILVFGKDKLARIASSDVPEGARILRIALGPNRSRLQELLTLVRDAKGHHDYAETA